MPGFKPTSAPLVVGFDVAGVVKAVGRAVTQFKVGDEVYALGLIVRDGFFTEEQLADSRTAALKPKSLNFAEAAALPLAFLTAYEDLHDRLRIQQHAGQTIYIHNGAGGVGSAAIQLAKLAGLKVITSASRPETKAWVKKLGADYVIDHSKDLAEEFKAQQLEPVRLLLNAYSEKAWPALMSIVAPHASVVGINADAPIETAAVRAMFAKNTTLHMNMLGHAEPGRYHHLLTQFAADIDAKRLQPIHGQAFRGFDAILKALQIQEAGKAVGKLTITMD